MRVSEALIWGLKACVNAGLVPHGIDAVPAILIPIYGIEPVEGVLAAADGVKRKPQVRVVGIPGVLKWAAGWRLFINHNPTR
jgi:hypothetical protein